MSAREPFFPKRSEKISEPAKPVQNQNQNPAEPPAQPSSSDFSLNGNHRPLNVSGLIKSKSSKKKESNPNPPSKPRGSFEHIRRPIPPPKSKPILEAIAQNNRQTSQANLPASASAFSVSISNSVPADAPSKPLQLFKSISAGALAESSPAIASTRTQGSLNLSPVQNASAPSHPQLTADRNNNSAHIRPQAFGSPDPFHLEPSDNQPSFGSGLRLATAAAIDGSSAPMLAMSHKATSDKRGRSEDDDGQDVEDSERVGGGAKRHKQSGMQDVETSPAFSPNVPTQHRHYYRDRESPAAMMLYDNDLSSVSLDGHQAHPHLDDEPPTYNHNHPSSRASTVAREFSEIPEPATVQGSELSVLEDILGVDVNAVVLAKLDQYEVKKKKWAEGTPENWSAGKEELVEKFIGLMDFVKDHMAAKTKLFESVDGKIAAHKDVLKTRADVLVEVKAGLIANGKALA